MAEPDEAYDEWRSDDCTTTRSFSDHGIGDGVDLVTRTYYRLQGAERHEFEPTEHFFDQLESAFIWAYLGSVDESGVPAHVEMAIEDARAHTQDEFDDSPDADLRTEVIPAFYRRVAGFHCIYRN
jgi:hypothetical protein